MSLLRKVTRIFDSAVGVLAFCAAVLLVFTMLGVSTDVSSRYFLNRPIPWLPEVTEYSLLYLTFLGATWVLIKHGHIKMDIVLNRLNPGVQHLLNGITSIICAVLCLVIAWYSAESTLENFRIGYFLPTELKPPKFIVLAIIPVGSFLLFIQFLREANRYLRHRKALPSARQ